MAEIHRGNENGCLLTFCMASNDGCDPAKQNHKGGENEDCETNLKIRFKQDFKMNIGLLEIQYENKRPTLSCEGSLLTKMEPSRAGTNMSAAAYPRPTTRREATVIPSQIVRTRWCLAYEMVKVSQKTYSRPRHPRSQATLFG